MIRNVCIHVSNEQPLLCDLLALPTSADAGLLCTNVRSMDGRRPVFIDDIRSTFFFPYHVVRFLEIPERSMAAYRASGGAGGPADDTGAAGDHIATGAPGGGSAGGDGLLPVLVAAGDDAGDDVGPDDLDLDLEIDEDFLKRVRDI